MSTGTLLAPLLCYDGLTPLIEPYAHLMGARHPRLHKHPGKKPKRARKLSHAKPMRRRKLPSWFQRAISSS